MRRPSIPPGTRNGRSTSGCVRRSRTGAAKIATYDSAITAIVSDSATAK
jgi:hypothetical protein